MRPLYLGRLVAAPSFSLARANGWGSAGQCPAVDIPAKTPAVREACLPRCGRWAMASEYAVGRPIPRAVSGQRLAAAGGAVA